ncbi:hypothetical protein [Streptomyces sp. NPDC058861]|uniref:hypothetical protein n=1 Tax=Streptomyces sp. NPDC058861 TaxID=3346653 RepID=UPI0036B0141E
MFGAVDRAFQRDGAVTVALDAFDCGLAQGLCMAELANHTESMGGNGIALAQGEGGTVFGRAGGCE